MQIQTIKISAAVSDDNPLGYVVINLSDFDVKQHEPFDTESAAALAGAIKTGEIVPPPAELLAARDRLHEQERALGEREAHVALREQANIAEAQRLAEQKAALVSSGSATDYSAMTKEQLQAALTDKGTSFPAAANKADLIALLTGA